LTVSAGSLSFDANTTSYTVNVANEVTSINVTGTANHNSATVNGNGNKSLNIGNNEVNIIVTAEDGVTTMTYTVTIVRADRVLATEANLVSIAANGTEITITGNSIEYAAACGETSLALDLETSPHSTVTVNGYTYTAGQHINFTGNVTIVVIRVTSETGDIENNYTLKVGTPINEGKLYFQRWSDVIAINRIPANNGNYNVSEVRWYDKNGTFINNRGYVQLSQGASVTDYYAEIYTEGVWRRVCSAPETRKIDGIIAYPNPVPRGEIVQLQLPDAFVGSVLNIYDMKGRLVKSGVALPAVINSVNVAELDSGIYLFDVTGNSDHRSVKIIIE
jgi:hypothetical protein